MAKQFLNGFKLSSALHQTGGEVMSQRMRGYIVNSRCHGILFNDDVKAFALNGE